MLLAIDIGNSAIKLAVFDRDRLISRFRVLTEQVDNADGLSQLMNDELKFPVTASIACSVVPKADAAVKQFIRDRFDVESVFIDNTFDFGLKLKYETVETLGTDRLVNAFAAVSKYGTPVVVCSLGTATTIDAVNENHEYLGGVIAPGIPAMAEALHRRAAKLPHVEIEKPENIIGKTTVSSIQSGIFYGYASLVDGLVRRISAQLNSPKVVATGGFAADIAPECESIQIVDETLLLDGLRLSTQR